MPPGPDPEQQPLLHADRDRLAAHHSPNSDIIDCHIRKLHGDDTPVLHLRQRLQAFFASKWGHYFVIILVGLDIACIFADFLIQLHVAEHTCRGVPEEGFWVKGWERALEVLGTLSLVFSGLFVGELVGSFFAFGPSYFRSSFHVFDAVVIITAFVIDLLLSGPVEEAGSLIVILRLWRVFKIIEEFSAGAADEVEELAQRLSHTEEQLKGTQRENEALKRRLEGDGNGRVNSN